MNSKHGPNSWDDYLSVHQRRLEDLEGHFVTEDRLTFTRTATQVLWEGVILCHGGIEIHVRKRQAVVIRRGRPWVQTVDYSCHEGAAGGDRGRPGGYAPDPATIGPC